MPRTVAGYHADVSLKSLAAKKYLLVAESQDNEVLVAVHSGTVFNDLVGRIVPGYWVHERSENVVPRVESQHEAFFLEYLVETGRLGVLSGIAVAQETVVAGHGYFAVLVEAGKEVEALEHRHFASAEVLNDPSVLGRSQRVLHILCLVLDAQGGTLAEVFVVFKPARGRSQG